MLTEAVSVRGPDPKYNPRLALALSNARRAGMSKSVIEAAVARGQGRSLTGESLESVTIEAIIPPSVGAVIECQTDQKARVLQELRSVIKDAGGTITPTTYLFDKKGRIVFKKGDVDPDEYIDQVIEAGATDIESDKEGRLVVLTEPSSTKRIGHELSRLTGLEIDEQEIVWNRNADTSVNVEDEMQIKDLDELVNTLREESSVQGIYLNTLQKF